MLVVYDSLAQAQRNRVFEHFCRLESDARLRRFHMAAGENQILSYLTSCKPVLLVCWEEEGIIRGIVEVHPTAKGAEMALSIESKWRGHGLGKILFDKAIEEMSKRDIHDVEFFVSSHNTPMRALLNGCGARQETYDRGVIRGFLHLEGAAA